MKGYSLHSFLVWCAALAIVAAVFDIRSRRIPNWLTTAGLFAGILGHAWLGNQAAGHDFALHAAGYSLLGAAVVGVVPLLLWRLGLVGGGDVKIVMAVGAVCHASLGMTMVFIALSLMASVGIVKLAWDGNFFKTLWSTLSALFNPLRKKDNQVVVADAGREPLRFGPALALSAIVLVLVHGGL